MSESLVAWTVGQRGRIQIGFVPEAVAVAQAFELIG